MLRFTLKDVSRTFVSVALALATAALLSAAAAAQPLNFGAFTMTVVEKEMKLEHPTDAKWANYLMKDLPNLRRNDRNAPFIELTNDTDSTGNITEFHLTIGDTRFNFSDATLGVFAKLAKTTPGFSLESSTLDNAGDELVVKIGGGGLAPGDSLRFKIDIDVDAAFKNQFFSRPDYRTVMFDMNGMNVYGGSTPSNPMDDNAKGTATFDPAVGANFTVGPAALAEATVAGAAASFYNETLRRYRDKDPVVAYSASLSAEVVPEPGTAIIAAVGVAGVIVAGRRRRAA